VTHSAILNKLASTVIRLTLPFENHFPGKWRSGNRLSGKRLVREMSFREHYHPRKLLSGKRL